MNIQIHFKEEIKIKELFSPKKRKRKEKRKERKENVHCSFKVNIHHKTAAKIGSIIHVY